MFEADPSTGTPKIKGHFDSNVVLPPPLSTLSARDEQSLFSAIDSGSLQHVQDPLGPQGYLVPGRSRVHWTRAVSGMPCTRRPSKARDARRGTVSLVLWSNKTCANYACTLEDF